MAPKPKGGNGKNTKTDSDSPPSQKTSKVDASSSVGKAQDATQELATKGRAGSNGNSSTNPTSNTPPKTDPPPTNPSKPGKDDGPLNEKSDDPQNPTTDGEKRNTEGDPIDIATGEMILQQNDAKLQSVLPLVLNRTHLSSYRVGLRFGPSWTSTLDQRLEIGSAGVSFAAEDGKLLLAPTPAVGATARFAGSLHELTRNEDGGFTLTEFGTGRKLLFARGTDVLPLTAVVDRNGHRIEFDYDAAGNPVEVRHSGGYRIRVDSEDGLVTALYLREADNGDDVLLMRYVYEDQRLTEVINASGLPMRFTYDRAGRITSWTDRNGKWYRYTYDSEGRVVEVEGSGRSLSGTMEYDRENRITYWTNSQGARTAYHLNESGQTIREIDPLGNETRSEWDDYDRLLSRTDPIGRTTRYEYDDAGNLIAVTRPDGSQARFEYNDLRLPITVIAPDGTVSRREYDERGNLVRVVDPLGAVTRYVYDERGHLTSITDALGNVQQVETDAAGLTIAISKPLGNRTRYERDGFGRLAAVTDPLGGTTRFGWTVDGKPAYRNLPDGAIERWVYDGEGNLRARVDALGQVTATEVTHFDLPSAVVRPDGTRLEFGYDTELRLVSVTNEQGLVWRYEYDVAGNLVREIDFNDRAVSYRYDAAGQLVERTNGAGETAQFVRDALGNVIERRGRTSTSTFTYDLLGRLTEAMDGDTRVTYRRDAIGRVISESVNGRTVSSVYDALGRRIHRRTPSGAESKWEYDSNSNLAALHTAGQTLTFGYDAAGREVQRQIGADTVLAQAWDVNHRLLSQSVVGASGRRMQERSYSYRADGYLAGIDDQLTGPRHFELDPAGRVTAVSGSGWDERYAYDEAGNPSHAAWPVLPESADVDELGAREYSGTLVRRVGNVRYEHDAQGRVVLRQRKRLSHKPDTWRYYWDDDDRLVEVLTPDGSRWRYRYDALGRRVAKQRLSPDGAQVLEQTEFTWDGSVLAEQAHTVGISGGSGLGPPRVTVWEYEPGTFRPLTQTERAPLRNAPQQWIDEQFFSIITDLVGTPTELINDRGGIAWFQRTTLWGKPTAQSSAGGYTPLRFPGQYYDQESGLNYNFHRHYDPSSGYYVSADPLGLVPGPHPHRYVSNPTEFVDPLGLAPYKLNLGSGQNPMEGAVNLNKEPDAGVDVVASADQLPFRDGSFKEVHAVNPFGYQPVSAETARVLDTDGKLYVTGSPKNKWIKPPDDPESFGLVQETPKDGIPMIAEHQFGTQRLTNGTPLQTTENHRTHIYRKL
ncbi:RHS repeat-associated core domain-containing protein [Saccharopolyspora kobensis]|uniref:RHS repeat-associated core domain-containing protein n=1 Tax=Saccharopolyspora kobensis TaxID=146035 RepID=A0A1H6EI96_9PSEU|nr:RHS repeat-associated core domain-containing protein [Saccharopolyspora kobensis]SEG96676.1 RHS repeat-associated core domain-containing protein [Saccharopolyspora kobensis]SFF04803.1 RHS repeat-associated core domain-containing protein [Saccharopolyspora kobensis]